MTMSADIPPYRILVVDDNPRERVAMRGAIEDEIPNCVVCEAEDVEEAEQVLESDEPFDLAIVDLRMYQGEEGLELLGKEGAICRRHTQTRVIMMTSYATVESASKACEARVDAYISKKWEDSTKKLKDKVHELLEQRQFRGRVKRQMAAQQGADRAFEAHRAEWADKYAGKFLIVRDGEVVMARSCPHDLWEEIKRLPPGVRDEIGVIEVPRKGEDHVEG